MPAAAPPAPSTASSTANARVAAPVIRRLPPALVDQIAAGEVVVGPSSAIKELVENALDAGARRIEVAVEEDALGFSVADDGCGMGPEDAALSVERHATSKIARAEDLETVATRGFRGEALAAIASVSRFELRTRRAGDDAGTRLRIDGGGAPRVEAEGLPPGTTVVVRDLFYNVPARRKFLKGPMSEWGKVARELTRQALARPDVAFHVRWRGRPFLSLPPAPGLLERAEAVLPPEARGRLLVVEGTLHEARVRGVIGAPDAARRDRRHQHFFAGGRPIVHRTLAFSLQEAYRGVLMTGRFPVCALFVELPPGRLDVNVHPTKDEVRFVNESLVAGAIHRAALEALRGADIVPRITLPTPGPRFEGGVRREKGAGSAEGGDGGRGATYARGDVDPGLSVAEGPGAALARFERRAGLRSDDAAGASGAASRTSPFDSGRGDGAAGPAFGDAGRFGDPASQGDFVSARALAALAGAGEGAGGDAADGAPSGGLDPGGGAGSGAGLAAAGRVARAPARADEGYPDRAALEEASLLERLRDAPSPPEILGQASGTYLLADAGTLGLLVIDQHALHEKLLYLELRARDAQGGRAVQDLLAPHPFEAAPADRPLLDALLPALADEGFDVADLGGGSYLVQSVPAVFGRLDAAAFLRDLLTEASRDAAPGERGGGERGGGVTSGLARQLETVRRRIGAMAACRAAIKAGDRVSRPEMVSLLERALRVEGAMRCPHGRPTMMLLGREQLDRWFGRLG